MKIWLVIMILQSGAEPMTLENSEQPDIQTCLAAAAHVLEQATMMEGEFELGATCSVQKEGKPL